MRIAAPRTYQVTGKRLKKIEPIVMVDKKTKIETVICDGKPETISLGSCDTEVVAEMFAANIRKNVTEETWTIKVKEIKL
jgi:hypothetical protein